MSTQMLCRHDESDDDRPDEWWENDWNGWPEVTPNIAVSGGGGADVH